MNIIVSIHRTPHAAMRTWLWILACCTVAICTFGLPPIAHDRSLLYYGIGCAGGCVLAAMLLASTLRGTVVEINTDGLLTYSQNGKENFRFSLNDLGAVGMVHAGLLRGLGCGVPCEQIDILHRKGVTLQRMREQEEHLGYTVVLEFLQEEDLRQIEQARLALGETTG